jgi:hypothetical protein
MKINRYSSIVKAAGIIFTIIISFMLLSTATAVPNLNAQSTIKQMEKQESLIIFQELIYDIANQKNTVDKDTYSRLVYTTALITEEIIESVKNHREIDIQSIKNDIENVKTEIVTPEKIMIQTKKCLNTLENTLYDELKNPDTKLNLFDFKLLKNIIEELRMILNRVINDILEPDFDFRNFLKGIFTAIITILLVLLQIIVGVITSVLSILWNMVKITGIILGGLQVILIVTAFFTIYMGVLARIGIEALIKIAAPSIAKFAEKLTIILGILFGNLALILSLFLSFAIAFAIPIIIGIIIITITGDGGEFPQGLASFLESIFGIIIGILPNSSQFLNQLWDWLGEKIQDWPPWPFSSLNLNLCNHTKSVNYKINY